MYQELIAEQAYLAQQRVVSGEDVIVGVNAFQDDEAQVPERFDVPVGLEPAQRARLEELRAVRDGAAVERALAALAQAAAGDADLMPPIVEAVDTDATLGEICGCLRGVFGEYRPSSAAAI